MVMIVAITAGVILGYAAGALFLPAASGGTVTGRVALALAGGLVGWWASSFAGAVTGPVAWVPEVTQVRSTADFDALASKSSEQPVLVDFYANWCPPCRRTAPNLNTVAQEGRRVAVVNVDMNPGLAERFDVSAIPTLIVLRGGQPVHRSEGYHSAADLRKLLEE